MKKHNKINPEQLWQSFNGMNATEEQINAVIKLLDEANRLGALSDPDIVNLINGLVMSPWDTSLLQVVNELLQPYRLNNVLYPDIFRPYPGTESLLNVGDIFLGTVEETGIPWNISARYLPHTLVTGRTGSGKTYFFCGFIEQISQYLPVIMVTLKPSDARLLVDPPIFKQAFRVEELKLSLFTPPPGVKAEIFQRDVLELLCKIWGLQLSRSILHEVGDELLQMYSDYSKVKNQRYAFTPTTLLKMLQRKRSKYADSVCASLDIFCRATGNIFEWSQGYPIEKLLCKEPTLLIINALSNDQAARCFVDWLMLWIHHYLEANGPNDGSPQQVIVLDDGHRFLSACNEKDCLTPLSHQYLTTRQAGMRILVVSQCPSDLAATVLSQSGLVFQVGGLTHSKDCQTMAAAFGMDPRDWQRLQKAKVAEFVARESLGRYDNPFAGYVRDFPLPSRTFTDNERITRMGPILNRYTATPAIPLEDVERALSPVSKGSVPARVPGAISLEGRRLAYDVLAYPWDFLNERYQRLGVAGRKAQNIKEELVNSGWVREHKIPKHGGSPILLEPLTPLGSALGQALPSTGKGGFLHAYGQHVVATRLKSLKFINIAKEKYYGSKAVDVVATDPSGKLLGYEIAMSLFNVLDNLQKDFLCQPNFAQITTICLSTNDVRQTERMISAAPALKAYAARIHVETLANWLP